jgi:DNA-binding NarL/FixJ family response regulator
MTRIVLADDHKIVRQGVRKLLEESDGFRIIGEAADGIEAVKLAAELKPDVLVTDLRMPGLSGVEVTRKVKESLPEIKVVVLSMYGSLPYVYSALHAGAGAYVVKESGVLNLDVAIYSVLKGERYLSPPLTEKVIEAYRIKNNKPPLPPAEKRDEHGE